MIYVKKFLGNNYFLNATYIDSLNLEYILGIPNFNWDSERKPFGVNSSGKINERQAGDFMFQVSFLQPERSTTGKTVKEFFLDNEALEDYFYMVIVTNGTETYTGTVDPENISAVYFKENDTPTNEDNEVIDLLCQDILAQWAKRCSVASLATLDSLMPNGQIYTFEQYIQQVHFNGLTNDKVLIGTPSVLYNTKLQPYGNPAGTWAYGDIFQFISNRASISRWEAFQQLRLGLGFEYEMYLSGGTEFANEPEFIFNIFFIADLENETPKEMDFARSLELDTYSKSSQYVYMRYRQNEKNGVDYSNGILFGKNDFWDSDANNAHDELYPCLLKTIEGKLLNYDNGTTSEKTVYKDIDYIELELKMYSYSHASGGGIAKLNDPNTNTNDGFTTGFAYSYIFKSATGAGTAIDLYNNKPIQRYAIQNYKRYLKAYSAVYAVGYSHLESDYIPRLFKSVNLNLDNSKVVKCFITEIENRDFQNSKSDLILRQY